MSDINISQNVSVTRCEHRSVGHLVIPSYGGGSGASPVQVAVTAVVLIVQCAIGAVGIVLRVAGPVLYFAGNTLELAGGLCKRLAPGVSAVGEEVSELALLGSGD